MCSTGSKSWGHLSGSCWTAVVLTSTWQGNPGLRAGCNGGVGQGQPCRVPAELSVACPSSNAKYMPADVTEALMSIFQKHGGLSSPEAATYLARLQQTLHFQTETWA